jgi:hypothetical protein
MWTDVQLEVGDQATPFERVPDHMELERCRRYYYATPGTEYQWAMMVPWSAGTSLGRMIIDYPVEMRVAPTWTAIVTQYQISAGGSWGSIGSLLAITTTSRYATIDGQCNQPFTAGAWVWSGRVRYTIDAEL